jgi:thioredoxin-related protein
VYHRRHLLRLGLCAACAVTGAALGGSAWAKENRSSQALPAPESMQDAIEDALRQQNPLIVMVSLHGCPFCKTVREGYLGPMLFDDKFPIVQVDMRSSRAVTDLAGKPTTHDELIRVWKVRVAPTLLFLGSGGRELAPRLVGASLPDFYGAYLDQRIAAARQALKSA